MIVVEGPDGAGKSTLVKHLQEHFPQLLLGERGTEDRDKLYEVTRPDAYRAISEALTSENPHIWDRLFWSELVYYPMTTGECQFNARDKRLIVQILSAMGVPVIFCMPPLRVVQENVASERQMPGIRQNLDQIYQRYKTLIEDSRIMAANTLTYDYTSVGADDQRQRIIGRIEAYLMERKPGCVSSSMTTP